ncbi:MAG: Xaa-Pro peptidase family protein [Acidimicrobiales bacterium]|jgi:Xaa-Pro aminopeptidase
MFEQAGRLDTQGFDKARLASLMGRAGLAAAVVTGSENVFYLTGYPTLPTSGNPILYSLKNILPFAVVVERDGTRHLVCWGFSLQDVDIDVEDVVRFNSAQEAEEAVDRVVGEVLSAHSGDPARIGVESTAPYGLTTRLVRLVGGSQVVQVMDEVLLELRRKKTEAEVELLRRSVQIAEGAIEKVFAMLKVGCSRLDAIRLAKSTVLELGGDGVGHVTMSFGHANPEIAIDERLREGDLVVVDVGAKLAGYTSDARRYGFVGEIPKGVLHAHATMVDIVAEVAAQMRPGTSFAKLMKAGYDGFDRAGLAALGRFNHVGHGIGLETEEEWIDDDPNRVIEEGMVVAIELYTIATPFGQIGDEETYAIRAHGPERLSMLDTHVRRV